MPLLTSPKAGPQAPSTPSPTPARSSVQFGQPKATSARLDALKTRLSAPQPNPNPVAPRPAGSSARAEGLAKLKQYATPQAPAPAKTIPQSRQPVTNLAEIEPPPSGALESIQPTKDIETAAPEAEANSEPDSPQLVALARKERQVRKAQQELKTAQDAWKQEQARYIPKEALLADPLKVLAEAGITAEKLVELQINQATPKDPLQLALDKIQQLEDKLNGVVDPETGELAKRDKQAYEDTVAQIEADATLLVESNPAFETIKSEGKVSEVKDLILAVFEEEGELLSVEDAAKLVEEKLVQNMLAQYERMDKISKIKSRLRKSSETAEAIDGQTIPAQQGQPKPSITTLTNSGAATRPLTARERAILKVQAALEAARK